MQLMLWLPLHMPRKWCQPMGLHTVPEDVLLAVQSYAGSCTLF